MGRLRRALGAGGLAVLMAGCPECSSGPPAQPVLRPAARAEIKVPLPPGWTALLGPDQSFRAGPPGRAVLRIDLRPGQGASLPDAAALSRAVEASLARARLAEAQKREGEGAAVLTYALAAPEGPPLPAMLGAKRLGSDLFLCASLPGASAPEVELAAEACLQLGAAGP